MTTSIDRGKRLNKRAFFRSLGYEPHDGQKAVHASRAPRRVLACGVRWGKTRSAAMEGIAAAMQPRERSMGWVVAPTYDLADKVGRELFLIAAEHLRHRIVTLKESERKLVLRNMAGGVSEIRCKSADNPVSLLGEALDWLVVDEAARLKPAIWEGHLSQRLIDRKGWALLISTPKGKGWFYELFRRGQHDDPDYESWNWPSWTNPYLDRELIESERDRLPERVFAQEYAGEFVEGAGQVLRGVRDCAVLEDWQEPLSDEVYYIGLDLAKVVDYTVLVVVNAERQVVFADRWNKIDWGLQVQRVGAAARKYNDATILVDSTGAGEPIYEALCNEDLCVSPYQFTARSKAALVDNLAMLIEKRELALPSARLWPIGIDELEAYEFSVSDAGNVKTGAPSGSHDDCVMALGLAAWQVQPSNLRCPIWII